MDLTNIFRTHRLWTFTSIREKQSTTPLVYTNGLIGPWADPNLNQIKKMEALQIHSLFNTRN
jgi:hypothetical protein